MNEAMENMLTRRSVRKYKDQQVPKEVIDRIVEAGLYAASGKNMQTPIIIAITSKEIRDRLSEANRLVGGWDEGFDPFYGAPDVLLVLSDKSSPNHVYDGACTMQNLMNAAHAEGLGSCWINRAREEFEQPEWKEWLKSLGIEGDYEGIGHCIIGYADGPEPKTPKRKPNRYYFVE